MRTEIKFGLTTIIVGILWVMTEHIAGLNTIYFEQGEMARTFFAFMPFVFLFLGIRAKKKQSGKIRFLSAWRTGSLIAMIYSIGFGIWFWLYASLINPVFLQNAKEWENKKLINKGLSGRALTEALNENTKMYGGSTFSYIMLSVSFFAMGVVVSAIIALLIKSKKEKAVE
jgi:hypothetical protein